jgi:hypothetical protein
MVFAQRVPERCITCCASIHRGGLKIGACLDLEGEQRCPELARVTMICQDGRVIYPFA